MTFEKIGNDGRPLGQPTLAAFVDAKTGLMWAAEDLPKRMCWSDANAACAAHRGAGFDDWRLPTRAELLTLVDDTRCDPAADPELGLKSSWYWTSMPLASSPAACAWNVNFDSGLAYYLNRSHEGWVRPVRVARASQ